MGGVASCRGSGRGVMPALGLLLAASGAAHAQTSPDRAVAPTREELSPVPETEDVQRPRLSVIGDIERSPCPLADPKFKDVTVPVNTVTFNNLKGATAEELRAAWAPFAGTRQPVAVLCEIRDAAATILRQKGYLAAVQVPAQRIEDGQIRMEVLYARLTAVRARGQTRGAEAMIARYLGRLTEDEIFNRYSAERYLLLARDLPGYNVQLTLKPAGTGPGDLIGEVTVLRRPFVVDATVQNLSSNVVGRWGGQVRAQAFGLTGMGDATSISLYSTSDFEEQQILQVAHEFRLGGDGLKLSGQFTHAWTEPDVGPSPVSFRARTAYGSLEARYPLLLRQSHRLSLAAGFDLVDQHVDFGASRLSTDRLRVLYARASGEAVDLAHQLPRWRVAGSVELRKGVSIFSATDYGLACGSARAPSRCDGDPNAGLVRAAGLAEVSLGRSLALAVAPRVQFAFDPVFAFEEYSAGNYTIGRGFDPGTIGGDSGIGASVELRARAIRVASKMLLRPYVFVDGTRIWNKNEAFAGPARGLLSLGGGVRAELSDRLRLDATLAVPTDTAGFQADRSARLLITLTSRILPWSAR